MNVLIKRSSVILFLSLALIFYFQVRKSSGKPNLSTIDFSKDGSENLFLVQDSLVTYLGPIKRVVNQGYSKNSNDTLKWDDIIKIYHISGSDTILEDNITFLRQENEGRILLMDNSLIPDETVDENSFIIQTAISDKGNFSENAFTFNNEKKKYEFVKRVNYMDYMSNDTLGIKTVYFIKNTINIDSTEMHSIFISEHEIYNGIYSANSEWIIREN
ncbi:hypothetical protein SAMN05444362_11266 [Dysgonomonas macrotermitis]|uniref:Uncharacterized protein n=2 Tax=Dysgonomonas macrotermitis TaxID=1346286 RepID=A0A1M5FP13_9BACT|nr:hypothetical protein SAMN05444362_11266 [Dysgonomonas macrotermitis]